MTTSRRLSHTYTGRTTLTRRQYLDEHFPGRRLLTLLRIDDLPLAGATGFQAGDKTCPLCGQYEETRQHFTLMCTALTRIRNDNTDALPMLLPDTSPDAKFRRLILAEPTDACHDAKKARAVAKYLRQIWNHRLEQAYINNF